MDNPKANRTNQCYKIKGKDCQESKRETFTKKQCGMTLNIELNMKVLKMSATRTQNMVEAGDAYFIKQTLSLFFQTNISSKD
jgi:hypothetical protein